MIKFIAKFLKSRREALAEKQSNEIFILVSQQLELGYDLFLITNSPKQDIISNLARLSVLAKKLHKIQLQLNPFTDKRPTPYMVDGKPIKVSDFHKK